jgi:hypothetical protein
MRVFISKEEFVDSIPEEWRKGHEEGFTRGFNEGYEASKIDHYNEGWLQGAIKQQGIRAKDLVDFNEIITKLHKENEQLKQTIKELSGEWDGF